MLIQLQCMRRSDAAQDELRIGMQERTAGLGARRVRRWEDRLAGDGRRNGKLELCANPKHSAFKRFESGNNGTAHTVKPSCCTTSGVEGP